MIFKFLMIFWHNDDLKISAPAAKPASKINWKQYLDMLLPGLDGDLGFFAVYAVSLLLQFGLSVLVMPRVQVAYALYYNEKGQA